MRRLESLAQLRSLTGKPSVDSLEAAFAAIAFPIEVRNIARGSRFSARVASRDLDSFVISRASIAADNFHSQILPRAVGSTTRYLLRYLCEGRVSFTDSRGSCDCGPGSLVLLTQSRPMEILHSGARSVSMALPGHILRAEIRNVDRFCYTPLPATVGPGRLLSRMLEEIWSQRDELSEDDSADASAAVVHLLRSALRIEDTPVDASSVRMGQITRVIEQHLPCEELNADLIGHMVGISKRHLYGIVARHGTTVGKLILEKRLEKCFEALTDPALRRQSVTEIAFGWGFKNISHFSHRFSRRYGIAPRQIRSQSRSGAV